jgi:hypothetical protein
MLFEWGRDGAVGIATTCAMDSRVFDLRWGKEIVSSSKHLHTDTGALPAPLMCTMGSPEGKEVGGGGTVVKVLCYKSEVR